MARRKVICDHAGRKRCVPNCRHANPDHIVHHTIEGTCTDPGECSLNPYLDEHTYARVCCRPVKEAKNG